MGVTIFSEFSILDYAKWAEGAEILVRDAHQYANKKYDWHKSLFP